MFKGQSYNVTLSVWRVFAHNSTKKSCRNTEIDRKVVRSVPVRRSKDQRSRSPGRLMPWPKTSHIFGMGRHRNFKLDTVAYGWRPDMRDDLKGQRSIFITSRQFDACDACVLVTQQRKVAETPKLTGTLSVRATADILHQFQGRKIKGQGHQIV